MRSLMMTLRFTMIAFLTFWRYRPRWVDGSLVYRYGLSISVADLYPPEETKYEASVVTVDDPTVRASKTFLPQESRMPARGSYRVYICDDDLINSWSLDRRS